MRRDNHSAFRRQIILDIFCSCCLLGILLVTAIQSFRILMYRTVVLSEVLNYTEPRIEAVVKHAQTGTWSTQPRTDPQTRTNLPDYENGAFHQRFSSRMSQLNNKVVTTRPVTPEGDSLGPLIWVTGSTDRKEVHGENRTTIDERYIGPILK